MIFILDSCKSCTLEQFVVGNEVAFHTRGQGNQQKTTGTMRHKKKSIFRKINSLWSGL